jgi:hypothetical protein
MPNEKLQVRCKETGSLLGYLDNRSKIPSVMASHKSLQGLMSGIVVEQGIAVAAGVRPEEISVEVDQDTEYLGERATLSIVSREAIIAAIQKLKYFGYEAMGAIRSVRDGINSMYAVEIVLTSGHNAPCFNSMNDA